MNHRPIILSLTGMHESGLSILREAAELRMASGLDPATLQREVIGAEGLIIRTGRRRRRRPPRSRRKSSGSWAGMGSVTIKSISMPRRLAEFRWCTLPGRTRKASSSMRLHS